VERSEENESFQTKIIIKGNEKKCMFKRKYGKNITQMYCVGLFIVLMMGKMLKVKIFKF
jgi:hypothetical protein